MSTHLSLQRETEVPFFLGTGRTKAPSAFVVASATFSKA